MLGSQGLSGSKHLATGVIFLKRGLAFYTRTPVPDMNYSSSNLIPKRLRQLLLSHDWSNCAHDGVHTSFSFPILLRRIRCQWFPSNSIVFKPLNALGWVEFSTPVGSSTFPTLARLKFEESLRRPLLLSVKALETSTQLHRLWLVRITYILEKSLVAALLNQNVKDLGKRWT